MKKDIVDFHTPKYRKSSIDYMGECINLFDGAIDST